MDNRVHSDRHHPQRCGFRRGDGHVRAWAGMGLRRFTPGIAAYKAAARLAPENRTYRDNLAMAQQTLNMRQFEQMNWLLDHPGQPMPPGLRPRR